VPTVLASCDIKSLTDMAKYSTIIGKINIGRFFKIIHCNVSAILSGFFLSYRVELTALRSKRVFPNGKCEVIKLH